MKKQTRRKNPTKRKNQVLCKKNGWTVMAQKKPNGKSIMVLRWRI